MEDELIPKDHTRRYAKVTLYLEVPTMDYDKFLDEYEVGKLVEDKLIKSDSGILPIAPPEVIVSEVGSDNPEDFHSPVGFIAPDGKFYLIESFDDPLAHMSLSPLVMSIYHDNIDYKLFNSEYSFSDDYKLERAGFIKVHGYDIRYYAHLCAVFNKDESKCIYTPDPTDEQIKSIIKYTKRFSDRGDAFINDHRVSISRLKQSDKLQLRKIFEL